MNAEFIAMLDYLERERGIKRDILLEAVSNALLSASKKSVGAARDLRIDIDPKSGDIRALANLVVSKTCKMRKTKSRSPKHLRSSPTRRSATPSRWKSRAQLWPYRRADR